MRAAPARPARGSSAFATRLHLAGASFVLVLLASHRFATVATERRGRFEDPDASFHARRVLRTIAEGKILPPAFDAFENFPDGGRAVWPPLHDASLALLARVGGSTAADPERGMRLAAAFPVVELLLALLVAAGLARQAFGERAGTLAAWLFAATAALFRRGAYGEIDHNVTELLGALLLAALAVRLARVTTSAGIRSGSDTAARRFARSDAVLRPAAPFLWGGAVLLAMGFYAGLALAAGLVTAGMLAVDLVDEESAGRRGAPLAAGFALAALALPVFASLRVVPWPDDPWRLGPVYVLVLSAAAAGAGAVALVAGLRWNRLEARTHGLAGAALLAGLALALIAPAASRAGLAKGIGFFGSRDPWLATIDEFQPLVLSSEGLVAGLPALLTAAVVIAIAIAGAGFSRMDRLARGSFLQLAVPFGLYLLLALAQKRFLPPAAAFAAAAGGAAWGAVRGTPWKRWTAVAALSVALLLAAPNLLAYFAAALRAEAAPEVSAGEAAGVVLLKLTPEPGDPPAWGVLAPWEYGHPILWTSGRAVALNNFGSFHPGFARALHLFLETSPARAAAGMERLRLRYVVAVYPPNVVPSAAASLGEDPKRYFVDGYSARRGVGRYMPTAEGERTLLVRLHARDAAPLDGDSPGDRAALARFRKVWESPEEGPGPSGVPMPFMKLFELLPPGISAFASPS